MHTSYTFYNIELQVSINDFSKLSQLNDWLIKEYYDSSMTYDVSTAYNSLNTSNTFGVHSQQHIDFRGQQYMSLTLNKNGMENHLTVCSSSTLELIRCACEFERIINEQTVGLDTLFDIKKQNKQNDVISW